MVKESGLLKALSQLEDAAEKLTKGDALEDADTEGGFSTEGEPLSSKAPSGKSDTMKSKAKSKVMAKMMSASDMGSDEEEDGGDASPDMGSDEGDDAEGQPPKGKEASAYKSLRQNLDADPDVSKALEISEFLSSFADQHSSALGTLRSSLHKSMSELSDAVDSTAATQRIFNTKLAKAMVMMGSTLTKALTTLEAVVGQPNVVRTKSILSKSDIQQSTLDGSDDEHKLPRASVEDWLVTKSMEGKIDPVFVTQFEQNGYDLNVLPSAIRKALVNDLGGR
jgi:hypothetical protein